MRSCLMKLQALLSRNQNSFEKNIAKFTKVILDQEYLWKTEEEFKGKKIAFGSIVEFQPQPDVQETRDDFMPKRIPGIFVGYHVQPGGK